ncbi:ACP phosphodiesterase [Hafnia alvei]|jgi:acyl carrier protein phosphodiesterase|uniref:ACP phosphodiesterase n=3 Tax=Hafnia alvei TaxID=569 RepID=A0A097R572_HAFAL|nr:MULTISPECIES: ACP phosphodiesterase [Hafnia]MDN5970312.1 ACP phosphodiesterase [Enterobacterales bacterium]MDN5987684.1 ACP phosphodiesterase [Hafniaceae bacterium]AIU73881.1 ACP phosphodiesterase [Hafnia alvei FB1]AWV45830.1 ACP phosphodiesterase [Hafnia alvei]KFC85865.1 acyl carrier protein phosphodiesterase [Hafnia alvei ATCC 13337]
MNFLAHLHLASLANSSLYGNILADFVRGNPQGNYSDKVIDGIFMHRRVDVMTDRLPQVLEAKRFFREEFRRVAPITLDVVWDHFLALHWQELEPAISLQAFVNRAQIEIVPMLPDSPERFQNLNAYMWQERWLERYAELPFIAKVLQGMANRRPKLGALAGSFIDIENNYTLLEQTFWQFYPQMIAQAKAKTL